MHPRGELSPHRAFPPYHDAHFASSQRRVKACGMSNDSTRQHLLGTWKLITAVREEVSSGTKTQILGPNPGGYNHYRTHGGMLRITAASIALEAAGHRCS